MIPGLPKVHPHNKVLSPAFGGQELLEPFFRAASDELGAPFIFVVEGSIPNERISGDGYWTSMGNDPVPGEPLTLNWWIDRLAPRAWAVVAADTCATYGIHAIEGGHGGPGRRPTGQRCSCRTVVTWSATVSMYSSVAASGARSQASHE